MIPKADHMISLRCQKVRPYFVLLRIQFVLTSVNLNNNFFLNTAKINDVKTYRMLAAKFSPV